MTIAVDYAGTWLSTYEYQSSSRRGTFTQTHRINLEQDGDRLWVISAGDTDGVLSLDLHIADGVFSGRWAETTAADSYYRGRKFEGLVMFTLVNGELIGQWLGVGGDGEVNSGPWKLTPPNIDS